MKPSPRLDQIRALREARYAEEQARQRAEGVKPVRRKKLKVRRRKKLHALINLGPQNEM